MSSSYNISMAAGDGPPGGAARPEVHVRQWLRGIVSRHSPARAPPPHAEGEPLIIPEPADAGAAAAPRPDLPVETLEALSQPWSVLSIEGWYRAHTAAAASGGGGGAPAPAPLQPMDEERFLTFGKQASSLSEVELLDLLDLFDRDSVGEIGFDEFFIVLSFLFAVETQRFAPLLSQHMPSLHEMLRRPGAPGPTPAAALQLCTLAGVEGQVAERCLAQLRLPFAAPIANRSDFGRLLFAALATQPEPVRTRLPAPAAPRASVAPNCRRVLGAGERGAERDSVSAGGCRQVRRRWAGRRRFSTRAQRGRLRGVRLSDFLGGDAFVALAAVSAALSRV